MAIGAYFDESGTHAASPEICVAGCIAEVDGWSLFNHDWRKALKDFDLDHFHLSFFEAGVFPFDKLGQCDRETIRTRLIEIINRTSLLALCCIIPKQPYRRIVGEEKGDNLKAYTVGGLSCMAQVKDWAGRESHVEPIAYFFEDGVKGGGQLIATFNHRRSRQHLRSEYQAAPGSPSFGEKKELQPLQAADIFAREIWRTSVSKIKSEWLRRITVPLLEPLVLDDAELVKLLELAEQMAKW